MAPTKVKAGTSKGAKKRSTKPSPSGSSSKIKKAKASKPAAKPVQQKTKSSSNQPAKRKQRVYTAKELGIPELNGIRPTGIQKAPNMKKGKVFTNDGEGMKAIMAMVMAEKEGNIESKLMKARHLEELREARKAEMEKRAAGKKEGLEERKREVKDCKKRRRTDGKAPSHVELAETEKVVKGAKKRVSFG